MNDIIPVLLSNDILRRMMNNQPVSVHEFNLATAFLVFSNIPFETSYDGATRKLAPAVQLTIHINPGRTEVLVVSFTPGSNAYTTSP